jgi:hypothetical protein
MAHRLGLINEQGFYTIFWSALLDCAHNHHCKQTTDFKAQTIIEIFAPILALFILYHFYGGADSQHE